MELRRLSRLSGVKWRIEPRDEMRVPAVIYADMDLLASMDDMVFAQLTRVATLPGIVGGVYAMPDAHWGYGFPIGAVAAFDPEQGGVISSGGVGFGISCGVRLLSTGIDLAELEPLEDRLADRLFAEIPAGVGGVGNLQLDSPQIDAMLTGGARWAVERGWGTERDLGRIEGAGQVSGAAPGEVSAKARARQRDEMGTLGSGNHYLEVQWVAELFDIDRARAFGLAEDAVVVTIHSGSRGLGHQVGTEFLRSMWQSAPQHKTSPAHRELACAPIGSAIGRSYLGALRAATNCALANRQILTHLTRKAWDEVIPNAQLELIYDMSHNTCNVEEHEVGGTRRTLFVHRRGATRALPPGHAGLPDDLRAAGQPVVVCGSMGTDSYVLAGSDGNMQRSFGSACHGAGRVVSRSQARNSWRGEKLIEQLASRGILIRSRSYRGVAEEAPLAYKDVTAVVDAAEEAGLACKVARLAPIICIKG